MELTLKNLDIARKAARDRQSWNSAFMWGMKYSGVALARLGPNSFDFCMSFVWIAELSFERYEATKELGGLSFAVEVAHKALDAFDAAGLQDSIGKARALCILAKTHRTDLEINREPKRMVTIRQPLTRWQAACYTVRLFCNALEISKALADIGDTDAAEFCKEIGDELKKSLSPDLATRPEEGK